MVYTCPIQCFNNVKFRMLDAKKKLEEELRKRREAEALRLAEIERQKELAAAKERQEQER